MRAEGGSVQETRLFSITERLIVREAQDFTVNSDPNQFMRQHGAVWMITKSRNHSSSTFTVIISIITITQTMNEQHLLFHTN